MRKVFQDVISVIVFEIWPGIICEHGTKNFPLAYDLWLLKSVWPCWEYERKMNDAGHCSDNGPTKQWHEMWINMSAFKTGHCSDNGPIEWWHMNMIDKLWLNIWGHCSDNGPIE